LSPRSSYYDRAAAGYDERHAATRAARRRAAVLDGLQLRACRGSQRVLEIGCGTGRLLSQVAAPVRIGVDPSRGMLARAAARGLDVAQGDGNALPFADASFDAIVAGKGVFRYLDPARAFRECARVLTPGGVLALHQYGNRTWSPRGSARAADGVWELGRVGELLDPARAAGFAEKGIYRFRPLRIYPYLLEIPAWIDRRAPVQLWAHVVAILEHRTGFGPLMG
jgi:SAM-dependent methyltransferase